MKCPVKNLENKVVGEIGLPEDLFGIPSRPDILARVIHWQMAKARAGTHKTKVVSEVSGTTRKPYRQKGTGRARQGSLRSPQFRGGAIIFGPVVRDHGYKLPKKVRQLGLKVALSQKFADGELIVVDELKLKSNKAQDFTKLLHDMGITSALFIGGQELDPNVCKASSNLVNIDVLPQQGANVQSILKRKTLILSKDAIQHLEARLK